MNIFLLTFLLRDLFGAAGRMPVAARIPAVVLSLVVHLVLSPLVTTSAHVRLLWRPLPPWKDLSSGPNRTVSLRVVADDERLTACPLCGRPFASGNDHED